jgi:hypothetical protein
MNAIAGTMKNGQVVLDEPTALPDRTRVTVVPVTGAAAAEENDGPPTPEVIAARLALMDAFEPGWLAPEDDAVWRAALREQKESEKVRFFEDAELRNTAASSPT